MTLRPCLSCGVPSDASRCPPCSSEQLATRDKRSAHFNTARWKRLSKRLRRMSPFCERCGAVEHLQVDHIVRLVDRPDWCYEVANLRILCRSCNSSLASMPATAEQVAAIEALIAARKSRRTRVSALTKQGEGPSETVNSAVAESESRLLSGNLRLRNQRGDS